MYRSDLFNWNFYTHSSVYVKSVTMQSPCGFRIIRNIAKVNKYFVGIFNLWIALPTENTKINVQQINMILQYIL